ncbi:glutathione S-transferase family protein [Ramlibacter pallidus]|uniref:Glutathione S-transferase N-terminal domain-containing protein n=1 Tax=Ramlibacter pallidus TaxID=2780087 RepID=A0ABR9S651_9BURK|nr:glutathione S-transferase [Ramlibacter pallidus]MBE7368924.1 glutathione S-transferase N-terminal domain-containing protein [Ramlibacter pallidus]
MYKLHSFCQSGNCYKVAVMLDVLGQPWEPVFIDFFHGQTRSAEYRETVNEQGEAPVLDDGGLRLTQSGVILTHLARKHGRFGGDGEAQQREVLRWLLYDNHKFTSYFATYRFMYSLADAAPNPVVMDFLRARFEAAFGIVDKHLQQSAFMVGDAPTIADFSMCGYLFYPVEETGYDVRAKHPAIGKWLASIEQLPGWRGPYECLPGERMEPRRRG